MSVKKSSKKSAAKKSAAKKPAARKTGPKAVHSDRQKAGVLLTLKTNRGSVKKTSRQTGIAERTIADWRDGYGINDDVRQMVKEKSLILADELEAIAFMCVGVIPQKLETADLRDVVGAMSQSIDKSLLLRGQPTEIIRNTTDEELRIKYNEVVDRLFGNAQKRGEKITREEIVERVVREKPQTAPYLKLVKSA
jgi:hypothetical protein